MKIHSSVLAGGLAAIVLAGVSACSSNPSYPSLRPVMANPPPPPVPVMVTEPPAMAAIPDTARPVPTAGPPDSTVGVAVVDGSASVPGVTDPWLQIKDYPFDRRSDFVAQAEGSFTLFSGAVSVTHLSQAKPDMAEAHVADIRRLDKAMVDLNQARQTLNVVSSDQWERAKNDFHAAWQNAQAAYAQARVSGT